jgi:hypothetical protein
MFAPYLANVGTRFLIPSLPFFAMALAMAITWPPALAAILLFHAVASWPSVIPKYAATYCWRLDRILWKQAIRKIPQDVYLRQNFQGYGIARLVEDSVPAGKPVLTVNGLPDAYTTHEILVGFQSAYNDDLADILNSGWDEARQPTRRMTFNFPRTSVRRVRVLQTGVGAPLEEFKAHELRFFSGGTELQRAAGWRLRAWPNPWDVQMAFDNSPATRWRSWETAFPGMYIDADFGSEQAIDRVMLDTSFDYANLRLEVDAMQPDGKWVKIASDPKTEIISPPVAIRKWATRELHERGINYVLMQDTDWGADDMREDPESWGFELVAKGYGARIYKVVAP